jgi:hypothetical protein
LKSKEGNEIHNLKSKEGNDGDNKGIVVEGAASVATIWLIDYQPLRSSNVMTLQPQPSIWLMMKVECNETKQHLHI